MSDRPPVLVSSRVEHLTMWASSDKFSTWALSVFYMRGWPHNIWITTLFYVNVIYESHYLMAILIYWEYLSSSFKMSIDLCPFSHNSRLLPRWTKRIRETCKVAMRQSDGDRRVETDWFPLRPHPCSRRSIISNSRYQLFYRLRQRKLNLMFRFLSLLLKLFVCLVLLQSECSEVSDHSIRDRS